MGNRLTLFISISCNPKFESSFIKGLKFGELTRPHLSLKILRQSVLAIGGRETVSSFLRDILSGIAWTSGQPHILFSLEAKEGILPECLYPKEYPRRPSHSCKTPMFVKGPCKH